MPVQASFFSGSVGLLVTAEGDIFGRIFFFGVELRSLAYWPKNEFYLKNDKFSRKYLKSTMLELQSYVIALVVEVSRMYWAIRQPI